MPPKRAKGTPKTEKSQKSLSKLVTEAGGTFDFAMNELCAVLCEPDPDTEINFIQRNLCLFSRAFANANLSSTTTVRGAMVLYIDFSDKDWIITIGELQRAASMSRSVSADLPCMQKLTKAMSFWPYPKEFKNKRVLESLQRAHIHAIQTYDTYNQYVVLIVGSFKDGDVSMVSVSPSDNLILETTIHDIWTRSSSILTCMTCLYCGTRWLYVSIKPGITCESTGHIACKKCHIYRACEDNDECMANLAVHTKECNPKATLNDWRSGAVPSGGDLVPLRDWALIDLGEDPYKYIQDTVIPLQTKSIEQSTDPSLYFGKDHYFETDRKIENEQNGENTEVKSEEEQTTKSKTTKGGVATKPHQTRELPASKLMPPPRPRKVRTLPISLLDAIPMLRTE